MTPRRATFPALVFQLSQSGRRLEHDAAHTGRRRYSSEEYYLSSEEINDFQVFERRVKTLDAKVRAIYVQVKQLRKSGNMLSCLESFRVQLGRLRDILRANMTVLTPPSSEWSSGFSASLAPSSSGNLKYLNPLLAKIGEDTLKLLLLLKEYSSFSEEEAIADDVVTSMNDFNKDLLYLRDCLTRPELDLESRTVKRYVHGLIVNVRGLGQHLVDVNAVLQRFHQVIEQVPIHLETRQQKRIAHLQSLSTVATLFSGVTATTLQFTYNSNDNALQKIVNFFWFTSLVFSIAAAVNSLQAVTWHQAQYAQVPGWVYYWVRGAPLFFLVLSVAFYSVGLAVFVFSSLQTQYTRIVTSVLTGISSAGLVAVSIWFLVARWESRGSPGNTWIGGMVIFQRFLTENVEEIERLGKNAIGKRSSDEKRARRLYLLQSFTLAVQRDQELRHYLARKQPPSPIQMGQEDQEPLSPFEPTALPEELERLVSRLGSMKSISSVRAHLRLVCGVDFSPNGTLLATACTDQTVVLIPLNERPNHINLKILPHPNDVVRQVLWSPTGMRLLVRLQKGFKIWNYEGKAQRLVDRERAVSSAVWFPKGEAFLSVEGNELVKMDTNGRVVDTYAFDDNILRDVALIPDSSDRVLVVGEISGSPTGYQPVRVAREKCIILYDTHRKRIVDQIMILGDVRGVRISKDGRHAIVSFLDRAITQLWRIGSGKAPLSNKAEAESILAKDSDYFSENWNATYVEDLPALDESQAKPTKCKPAPRKNHTIAHVRSFILGSTSGSTLQSCFLGDDDEMVACVDRGGYVHIWEVHTGKLLNRLRTNTYGSATIASAAWGRCNDRLRFATGASDGFIQVWAEEVDAVSDTSPPPEISILTPYSDNMHDIIDKPLSVKSRARSVSPPLRKLRHRASVLD